MAALAVILIACPCALALATPMAVWSAMGRAARNGILFRSGEALEKLARVTAVRFDKTGTLTTGSPRIVDVHLDDGVSYREFAARAKVLADASTHVFSRAIAHMLRRFPNAVHGTDIRSKAGLGIEAILNGESGSTRLGRWEWLIAEGARSSRRLQNQMFSAGQRASSIVAIEWMGRMQGVIEFAEELRPDVEPALDRLRDLHLDLAIVTGDRAPVARAFGGRLGLPVSFELSPAEKGAVIQRAQAEGQVVAMVGDGINDAPALSAADVGIALGCGTDVTRSSADVCLLRDDLTSLVAAIELSRDCVRCIRGNLAWAFAYNGIGVALAAVGALHPSVAAVLMVVSSLVVISRSMRLGIDHREQSATQTESGDFTKSPTDTAPGSEANELVTPLVPVEAGAVT